MLNCLHTVRLELAGGDGRRAILAGAVESDSGEDKAYDEQDAEGRLELAIKQSKVSTYKLRPEIPAAALIAAK